MNSMAISRTILVGSAIDVSSSALMVTARCLSTRRMEEKPLPIFLTADQAERVGLVSEIVPDDELMETALGLAKEIATRNPVALEHAKIAAYMERDVEFSKALRIDELVSHRMRAYTDPLADVSGYLKSQKGGGSVSYREGKSKK